MKKFFFTLIGLLAYLEIFAQLGYHYESKFIQLIPNTAEPYYVQTKSAESKEYLEKMTNTEIRQNNSNSEVYMISENSFFVSSMPNLLENVYISEMYQDSKGNPYYILPRIILSLKDNAQISNVIKGYSGILELDSIQRLKEMTTLTCNLSRAQEVLRVVGELDSFEEVEWCEPDMICKWEMHDSNPLFPMQYYLQNNSTGSYDINVVPVWSFLTGSSNITVAVIDEGVDPDHEDLSGKVLQGYTIGDATGYGKPKNANEFNYKGHGVACAGIIGAKNNDKGILGVAYGVQLLPVNVVPYTPYEYYVNGVKYVYNGFTTSDTDLASAIQWAAERADILSCSWGGPSEINTVKTAINNAMANGRNGKGCVVVASSGNNPFETVQFPARMEGVIAVGAIDGYGNIQLYSQGGNTLDLVAPSGNIGMQGDVVTTDRAGNLGFNPCDVPSGTDLTDLNYTQKFGGTSAACPQVAGVAALMLSANPNLTTSQVKSILQIKARKLPGMNNQNWTIGHGYGLVDAYAAVDSVISAALNSTFEIEGPQLIYNYGQYRINNLPSGVTVTWSVSNSYYNNYPYLISNFPALGWCLIFRDEDHDMINGTLTAEIKYNGVTVQTLTKTIHAYDGFWGQYTSGDLSGEINSSNYFYVRQNATTHITSPNLVGASASYDNTATIPTNWIYNSTNGTLDFYVQTNNPGVPVKIYITDTYGHHHQLYAMPTSNYNMNVSSEDNGITITLNEDGGSERGMDFDQSWTIEVCNATTGALMATRSSTSRSETISTAGWPKGIYIVKVTIGEEVLTEKVIVR